PSHYRTGDAPTRHPLLGQHRHAQDRRPPSRGSRRRRGPGLVQRRPRSDYVAMLFDLRSRGRRRTVQAVYLGLAILMGGGLVLFGVGAGNGLGGLLNAFTGKGSSNNQSAVVSQAEKNAIKATQTNPTSAAAWANLIQARWSQARSSSADIDP